MRRRLATLTVLLLIAILPLRAIASVVMSVCGAGHQQEQASIIQEHAATHQHGDHGAPPHQHDGESPGSADHNCGYCAKHCTSAAVVLLSEPALVSMNTIVDAIPFNGPRTPGFLPNQLDRPPLAS